jgi:hypothetical protein
LRRRGRHAHVHAVEHGDLRSEEDCWAGSRDVGVLVLVGRRRRSVVLLMGRSVGGVAVGVLLRWRGTVVVPSVWGLLLWRLVGVGSLIWKHSDQGQVISEWIKAVPTERKATDCKRVGRSSAVAEHEGREELDGSLD